MTPVAHRFTGLRGKRQGMALIAVLWLVAAMSILVLGATNTVQQHVRVTSQVRDQVSAQAVAEAAFALAMQQIVANAKREPGIQRGSFDVHGVNVQVQAAPLNGWINLGGVEADLLARVFAIGAGLPPNQAQSLAEAVVEWRDQRPEQSPDELRNADVDRFALESVDDLMQVPGMDYDVLARVRPFLVADLDRGVRVNPLAAPPEVLTVLADGNQAVAAQITANRERGAAEVDTSRLNRSAIQTSTLDQYRLQADIPLEAGKMLRVTQDVSLLSTSPKVAPWRVLRKSRQILASEP